MSNNGGEGFLLTTKLYNNPNNSTILCPCKINMEGKADMDTEGTSVNKKRTNINQTTINTEIRINEIHTNLVHPGEYRIHANTTHLHRNLRVALEV